MSVVYQTHTVSEIRNWLELGKNDSILDHAISRTRANALAHCPYVKDDDVLVVTATDGEKVVGYTAIFPEKLVRPEMWIATGTTLWVNPDYADEFVGYNLVQHLWQAYPQCAVIGSDVAKPAAMIDKLLGAKIAKYERKSFVLSRHIEVRSLRNVASYVLEPFRKYAQRKALHNVYASIPSDMRVVAREYIDAEAYAFIQSHSGNDTFLRSREMLNWILQYPFSVENPLSDRQGHCGAFLGQTKIYRNYLLHIYRSAELIGVVMLAQRGTEMHVKMLYVDESYRQSVYALIVEAAVNSGADQLFSLYPGLNEYIAATHVALRTNNRDFLFTYPKTMNIPQPLVLQGIEGDMFA